MDVEGVTVGLPVSDLPAAVAWYRRVLELPEPEMQPADGIVEWRLGPVWLQLMSGGGAVAGGAVLRLGVGDVRAERERLVALGVQVDELEEVSGVIAWFDLADPDGNRLSCYTEA